MNFKNYLKERGRSSTGKHEKPFSAMETINHINRLPQNQKTDIALKLEAVLRESIDKKKYASLVVGVKTFAEIKVGNKCKVHRHAGVYLPGKIIEVKKDSVSFDSNDGKVSGNATEKNIEFK